LGWVGALFDGSALMYLGVPVAHWQAGSCV
jgi:hypothetical protein